MVKLIYASLTGNTEIVCEKLSEILDAADLDSGLFKAEEVHNDIFLQGRDFVLATSTWNNGQLNDMFLDLYEGLLEVDLTGKRFGFIGLGEISYGEENFCKGAQLIRKRVVDSGGEEICDMLKLDGEFNAAMEQELGTWSNSLIAGFKAS